MVIENSKIIIAFLPFEIEIFFTYEKAIDDDEE
jgi:hypothetical protein